MKINPKWIDKYQPCKEAIDWWDKEPDSFKILNKLIKENKFDWANWFLVRLMNYEQNIRYAIYVAEQVIGIFKTLYPDDKRPLQAIQTAIRCLKNPSIKNKNAAAFVAAAAAYAANAVNAANAITYAAMREKLLRYGIKILEGV